ncbi:MAG: NHL repeat-containing protein, partial [Candidatus Aminicenantes bacterium]|nr:NHL repeat-containing protein [Candidatus Aminicenantes bacterium]
QTVVPSSSSAALQNAPAVVHNGSKGLWDDAPRLKLVFREMLGGEDDDNYLFYGPEGLASDSAGNVYVLDARNHRVQVFDSRLKFLRSFGRKGQGPGDLGRPECIDVDASGHVFIGDPGNGRIAVFDPEGKWLRAIPLPSTNIIFRVMRNGDLLLRNPNLDGGRGLGKSRVPLFRILDRDGNKKTEIGQGAYFEKFPFSTGGNRSLMAMDGDGNAYMAFLFQNKICKYGPDGRLLFTADRTLPKDKLIDKALDMYSTINTALDVDSKGRVWVVTCTRKWGKGDLLQKGMLGGELVISGDRTRTKTDLYEIQIFGPDGVLLQKIPLAHFCDYMKIVGDTAYLLDMDRLGQFYVYRIEEGSII